jgi:hypothetical protein
MNVADIGKSFFKMKQKMNYGINYWAAHPRSITNGNGMETISEEHAIRIKMIRIGMVVLAISAIAIGIAVAKR